MTTKRKTYTVYPGQIKAQAKGWLTIELSDGTTVKARKADVTLIEGGLANRRIGNRRYDCRRYAKVESVGGHYSLDNDDKLAKTLRGKELDEVYKVAAKVLGCTQKELRDRYAHLNPGMQRMNLGNRMRAAE